MTAPGLVLEAGNDDGLVVDVWIFGMMFDWL